MNIRPLQKENLSELLELYPYLHVGEEKIQHDQALEIWEQTEKSGSIIYWGLFLEQKLISTCQLVIIPNFTRKGSPYGLIENVVTHPEYRNQGFGKKTLQHALEYAWSKDCYKVMLMTSRKTQEVLGFYESVGFRADEKQGFVAKPNL